MKHKVGLLHHHYKPQADAYVQAFGRMGTSIYLHQGWGDMKTRQLKIFFW